MSFFDLNRKISYEHININKTSTKKWYEQLGATSSTLYTYGTTENEAEYYDAGRKLYKTFDCIKLYDDATLNFSSVFTNSDIENNYIFLKYYYVKYYYYDSEWDRPIYRWKYSSINEETIDSGYTTVLGNAFKLDVDKTFLLPKGEYSLNGWEIIKISKEAVADYFYADGMYKIGCSADKNNKVKDNLNINKVIDSKYVTDAKDYGNYAFYSIPSYAINNKNIRVFGNLDKSDNEGNYWNKDGIKYYYNDSTNKEISFGSSVNDKYFREEYYPIVLFNDFGWSISDIPSSSNPLKIRLDENRTNIVVSFNGDIKIYQLWNDDEIVLYARECTDSYTPQQIKYGYIQGQDTERFYGVLTNPNFKFDLNNIKEFNFYDFINNNKFELRDNIYFDDKTEFHKYQKIIKRDDNIIKTSLGNPAIFTFYPDKKDKYYNKYDNQLKYSFFFAIFEYEKLFFPSENSSSVYFNFNGFKNNGWPQESKWEMIHEYGTYSDYCLWSSTTEEIQTNLNNEINIILNNNQKLLKDNWINPTAATTGKENLNRETNSMKYEHKFSATAEASVGLIKQGKYWEINYLGSDMSKNNIINGIALDGYYHNTNFSHSDGLKAFSKIKLDITRELTINSKYKDYANVNQPAIAIVLWTKHEYQDNGSLYFVWKTIPNPIIPQHNSANIDLSKYYLTNGNPAFTASIAGGGFAQPTINGSILHIENQSATDTTTVIVNAILDNKRYETTFSILTK